MSASPTPPAAKRFAPYVDELQEFFASACLRYGSPEDIIAVTERLESSPTFAEDLGSMIRAIVLRESGSVQHSQLLEILALAIGGPKMDNAPQHYAQPLRNLLSFMTGVLRKPWNEPPETIVVERGEVVPFPAHPKSANGRTHNQAAAISAARETAAAERLREHPPASPARIPVPDVVGDPTPAPTSAQDPETPAHEAIQEPDQAAEPDQAIVAKQNAAAAPAQDPPAPDLPLNPIPSGAPSWQLAAKALRDGEAPGAAPRVDLESPATAPDRHVVNAVVNPVISDTPKAVETPARRTPYTPRVPKTAAGMLVTGAALLVLAGIFATSLRHTPTTLVGKQSVAQAPANGQVILPGGITPTTSAQRATKASAAVAVASPSPSPVRRTAVLDEDDDTGVAAPFSTPIPGQVLPKPSAYGPQPVSQAAPIVRPPSNEIASAATSPQPLGAPANGSPGSYSANSYTGGQPIYHQELRAAYRDPDAAIAGDLPRRSTRAALSDRPSFLDVSSGVMAGNLISAPMPDYPTLARLAHVGGEVVLQAVVAKNGSVLATHVLRGNRLLRGAAEDAVRQWRYRPYSLDGHPVEVATIVTVRFRRR